MYSLYLQFYLQTWVYACNVDHVMYRSIDSACIDTVHVQFVLTYVTCSIICTKRRGANVGYAKNDRNDLMMPRGPKQRNGRGELTGEANKPHLSLASTKAMQVALRLARPVVPTTTPSPIRFLLEQEQQRGLHSRPRGLCLNSPRKQSTSAYLS